MLIETSRDFLDFHIFLDFYVHIDTRVRRSQIDPVRFSKYYFQSTESFLEYLHYIFLKYRFPFLVLFKIMFKLLK